jgi:hypothetical protein
MTLPLTSLRLRDNSCARHSRAQIGGENVDRRPSLALRHPCCPIYPRHPYLPKLAKGEGMMLN